MASASRVSKGPAEYVDCRSTSRKNTAPRSSGTSSPGSVGAKSWTTPAGPAMCSAPAIASRWWVQTRTTSARSPSSASRTAPAPRPPATRAPAAAARARRSSRGSTATTAAAPVASAACTCSSPIEPAPTTATREPSRTPARRWPRRMQASGSISVAASSPRPSGSSSTSARALGSGTRKSSASPPGSIRVSRNVAQSVWRPARQSPQAKHGTWWWTNTRRPGRTAAPAPAATTSPTGSWPSTTGARGSWYQLIRSLPQRPQARIRTTSSPGPATGSGRSSTAMRPAPWYTAARTGRCYFAARGPSRPPSCQDAAVLAAVATGIDPADPLAGLEIREAPEPERPAGWEVVNVRAAALNHHDLWTLRGVGAGPDDLPVILGCDAAGVAEDGREVILYSVLSEPGPDGDETLVQDFRQLSERGVDGTLAERVAVPARNLVPKPPSLSFAEAACLPVAYLTAYRMLFMRGGLRPGDSVLVQGAGGGVATAAIVIAHAAGIRVYATSRDERKRERAVEIGAEAAVPP